MTNKIIVNALNKLLKHLTDWKKLTIFLFTVTIFFVRKLSLRGKLRIRVAIKSEYLLRLLYKKRRYKKWKI